MRGRERRKGRDERRQGPRVGVVEPVVGLAHVRAPALWALEPGEDPAGLEPSAGAVERRAVEAALRADLVARLAAVTLEVELAPALDLLRRGLRREDLVGNSIVA